LGLLVLAASVLAGEEVLIIEQDYDIVEQGKDGPQAKDVRQKLYISRDAVLIDEFGGKQGQSKATESILVDLKGKVIVNLNHEDKRKVTESFDDRRKRIEAGKKQTREDIDNHPEGANKERLKKLYRALLDDKRRFAVAKDSGASKKLVGLDCRPIKVVDADAPDYVPLEAQMHPSLEMPYDNTEVLYLLRIIGRNMAEFLRLHKESFKFVPMELHLDLAAGGRLDTRVIAVSKVELDKLPDARGGLGAPFVVPPYEEKQKRKIPQKKEEEP
jgi:hypothetical protein